MISRRLKYAPLLIAPVIAGCSSDGQNDWFALVKAARQSFSGEANSVSLQAAAAIPYATIGVRIGGGPQQLLILATDNGHDRLWTSAAHVAIATSDGRITRTAGLPPDLSGRSAITEAQSSWGVEHDYRWSADFQDLNRYGISVHCIERPAGAEQIEILGQKLNVVRIDESCAASEINWEFKNTYWVDALTHAVWRSIQTVHPGADAIEIEILRPPAPLAGGTSK